VVGAPNMPGNLTALATRGRIAVIGVGAGFKGELNLLALMGKRARIRERREPIGGSAMVARRDAAAAGGDSDVIDDLIDEIPVEDGATELDDTPVDETTAQAGEPEPVQVTAGETETDNG